jgi:hypothetical protein
VQKSGQNLSEIYSPDLEFFLTLKIFEFGNNGYPEKGCQLKFAAFIEKEF